MPQPLTLRDWADKIGFEIGATPAGAAYNDPSVVQTYEKLMAREFNVFQFDGELNWDRLRPSRDSFNFKELEAAFETSSRTRTGLALNALLSQGPLPEWLKTGGYGADDLYEILQDHISQVVGRMRGRVRRWVVVNEFVESRLYAPAQNFWYQNLGEDYVGRAFQWAREADPNTQLILNSDYNDGRNSEVTEAFWQLASRLKQQGIPIDGVGMQMHLFYQDPDGDTEITKDSLVNLMKRYANIGLRVFITEFDVDIRKFEGSSEERFQVQADIYRDFLSGALESNACDGLSVFTPGDRYSWLEIDGGGKGPSADADPTPFDDDLNPKPAYYAMRDVLMEAAISQGKR